MIAGILAAAALLRLHHLDADSLWLDEAYSIANARSPLLDLVTSAARDVHPPLYYLLLKIWIAIAGSSAFATRLLSVAFDVAAIGVVHRTARSLFGRPTAIAAAALIAASPFHVQYSQEARMYTLLAFLAAVSMRTFIAGFGAAPARRWGPAYVAATTLLLYAHAYAVFVVFAQAATMAVALAWRAIDGKTARAWGTAGVAIAALFLPWLWVLITQTSRVAGGFWIPRPDVHALGETLLLHAASPSLVWPLAIAAVAGAVVAGRSQTDAGEATGVPRLSLVLWLAGSTLLPFAVSLVGPSLFMKKYTIAASLPFLILAARGLASIPGNWVRGAVMAVVVAVSFQAAWAGPAIEPHDDWRRLTAAIEASAEPGDVVLFNQPWGQIPFDYYARRTDLIKKPFPPYDAFPLTEAAILPRLAEATTAGARVWLVVSDATPLSPRIAAHLTSMRAPVTQWTEGHVEIFLYAR